MQLLDNDAVGMITRVLHRHQPITAIDVGANVGDVSRRIAEVFTRARVLAFEPAPDVFGQLRRSCEGQDAIEPIAAAVGAAPGEADFHVTANRWCSSLRKPNGEGKHLYGEWYDLERTIRVPVVTLDQWAKERGIEHVDILKVDAQGSDLDVLRGATGLLTSGGVRAVLCEAPIVPQYEGSATLASISDFLSRHGFQLHQIHAVCHAGPEQQVSHVDGLWLRADCLRWLREDAQDAYAVDWRERAIAAARELASRGSSRIALLGAGEHTRRILPALREAKLPIAVVLDDRAPVGPAATEIAGVPVRRPSDLGPGSFDAVILSSHAHEDILWERASPWRDAGMPVQRLHPETRGGRPADTRSSQPLPAGSDMVFKAATPAQAFRFPHYERLNHRRLEHLASLGLPLAGSRVLEVGAGIGELTAFFLDRGCQIHTTDARQANVAELRTRFAGDPRVTVGLIDLDEPDAMIPGGFDVVFAYGVLYHLRDPMGALRRLAGACSGLLLVETCVSPGDDESINLVREDITLHSQAAGGVGCRPTRPWMMRAMSDVMPFAYTTRTQPSFVEFPTDWSATRHEAPYTRAIFVGSRSPLALPTLTHELPDRHIAA